MVRKKGQIVASLTRKGFKTSANDDLFLRLFVGEKKTAIGTKVSHGPDSMDIGSPLISAMSKQTGLSKSEFLSLVDCPLDKDRYVDLLRKKGKL